MDKHGLSRSDVARRVWGTTIDRRGYEVARNRQHISNYLSGKIKPSTKSKRLLSEALNIPYMKLFPYDDPINRPGSGITIEEIGGNLTHLVVNLEVPSHVAYEIIDVLREHAK